MGKSKYGRGLGREIFEAAKAGKLSQPFDVATCREFVRKRGWNPPESYIRVVLANSEVSRSHSETYFDYFVRVDEGKYKINPHAKP